MRVNQINNNNYNSVRGSATGDPQSTLSGCPLVAITVLFHCLPIVHCHADFRFRHFLSTALGSLTAESRLFTSHGSRFYVTCRWRGSGGGGGEGWEEAGGGVAGEAGRGLAGDWRGTGGGA
jgi:hypothetical protein